MYIWQGLCFCFLPPDEQLIPVLFVLVYTTVSEPRCSRCHLKQTKADIMHFSYSSHQTLHTSSLKCMRLVTMMFSGVSTTKVCFFKLQSCWPRVQCTELILKVLLLVPPTEELMVKPEVRGVRFLFLVGGFAESPMLQKAVQKALGRMCRIIIPHDVGLTILKGAVLFGLDPTVVRAQEHLSVGE